MYRILVIEDDKEINDLIYEGLKREQYEVSQVFDGKQALEKYSDDINLIILDLMLPKIDGIEVMRRIRDKSNVPIIILSAKDDECDRIVGLSMGADDYMSNPFSIRELVARVKAQLRRYIDYNKKDEVSKSILVHNDIKLDTLNFKVFKNDVEVILRPKEFEILKLLMSNPDRVFTREQIFEYVWKDNFLGSDNIVMVHIKRLRNKIEDDSNSPKYIVTVWGIGYKLGE